MGSKKSGNNCNCSLMKTSWTAWNENTCKFPWGIKKKSKPFVFPWAARNTEREGKWLLYFHKNSVNAAWDKIRKAVAEGKLWHSCMSETNPKRPRKLHEIMVYTRDHTDVNDIIRTLDYLESLGIKPRDENIKYVKNNHIGSISKQWLYSSNLIRSVGSSIQHIYEFDIYESRLLTNSLLRPTVTLKSDFEQLYARNNKYRKKEINPRKEGAWMIPLLKNSADATWNKIKIAVTNGELWRCSISTTDTKRPKQTYTVTISTKDYTDLENVIQVLDYLEKCGMKPPNVNIKYVSRGIHSERKLCTYTSDTVRSIGSRQPLDNDTYEFDIYKKEVVTDCKVYPTECSKRSLWLIAKNNKYADEELNADKLGKWMLFLPENRVNTAWDRIKEAVAKGELWFAKVCTDHKKSSFRSSFIVFVYTKDYGDQSDVFCVHECLASSGIKPPNVIIRYKMVDDTHADRQNGVKQKLYMYTSETVQGLGSTESLANFTYKFDIHQKKLVVDCDLYPTEASEVSEWLFAENNQHISKKIGPEKMGKWVVFLPENKINAAWKKIRDAIAKGRLWTAKVATKPETCYLRGFYAVHIYTKDFSDREDVIRVLDYLESSKIIPEKKVFRYYSEQQTHLGVSKRSEKNTWVYYSDTIRFMSDGNAQKFDISKTSLTSGN